MKRNYESKHMAVKKSRGEMNLRGTAMSAAFSFAAASVIAISMLVMGPSAAFAIEDCADSAAAGTQSAEAAAKGGSSLASADVVSNETIEGDGWTLDENGVLTVTKDISKPASGSYEWAQYDEKITEVSLAEGVTALPNGAFASSTYGVDPVNYSNLKKFTACSTLKTIGWDVFSGTKSLTEVHLNDGLEAVKHSAFAGTGITSIDLPNNVTLGGDCFTWCSQLRGTLVIPGGTKFESWSNATFYGIGVDTVIIEEGVTWIPNSAFNGCTNLKRVYLPKSVVQIGDAEETSPGIYYASFDPCTIIGYKGTTAEQYVNHWLEVNPEGNKGLSFHAIDGEEHKFGPWETVSEATCTEAGARKHTCTICGAERTESLPSLGHAWNEGVVTTEPTMTAEGVRTFTCSRCGATNTEAIAKLKQEAPRTDNEKTKSASGNLPTTGDPASLLGLLAASGVVATAAGEALRRRR